MDAARELLLLQICDSVFPIGAYSHSYGLEIYIQLGLVHDEATAWEFVERQIRYPLSYTELLGMRLAYEAAQASHLERIADEESLMAAAKVPDETRTASATGADPPSSTPSTSPVERPFWSTLSPSRIPTSRPPTLTLRCSFLNASCQSSST